MRNAMILGLIGGIGSEVNIGNIEPLELFMVESLSWKHGMAGHH